MLAPRAAAVTCLFLGTLLAPAQAPAGFRTHRDRDSGLEYIYPADYKEIPLAPTEVVFRARYDRKTLPDQLRRVRGAPKPTIQVFLFKERATSTTGTSATETPDEPDVPSSFREMMEQRSDVRNFDELARKRLGAWKLEELPNREGHYAMAPKRAPRGTTFVGYLVKKRQGPWTLGVYGITLEPYASRLEAILRRMATSLRLREGAKRAEADARVDAALDRIYKKGELRAIPHRKRVRRALAKGWKAQDTENYILVYHSTNTKLINKIARDIEAMRDLYARTFPPVGEVEAVSVVRICRNRGEYLSYGGRPGTGGFWHPGNEELVFYDYDQSNLDGQQTGGRRTGNRDSLLVLYHEAFHQYIHYAVGEVAPHDWFNEGHGDYFSGAVIPTYGKKVTRLQPSWWRIHRAKDQFEYDKGRVPLKRLLLAERSEFYDRKHVSAYYAAGWSFVYFLRESEVVAQHATWSQLLEEYFSTLKAAYAQEVAAAGDAPSLSAKQKAAASARKRAIRVMMKDLDLEALEKAWKAYVLRLKDPWPHLRKRPKKK